MLFKKISLFALISAFLLFPLYAEEEVDLNIEDDDPFTWVENFFNPIGENIEGSNVTINHNCSYCKSDIEDPEGADWWTPKEKSSSCTEVCIAKCEKRAKEAKKTRDETDDVREFFDRDVEYF